MIELEERYQLEFENKELLSTVRTTVTLEGNRYPYQEAVISVKTFNPNDLFPTAKYVLRPNLKFVSMMRDKLLQSLRIDILQLNNIAISDCYIVGPPVVEMSDGLPAIVDGIHRCELARRLNIPITVIFIDKVDPGIPIISYPVTWQQVQEYELKPENPHLLRDVRMGIEDESGSLKKYYRNFDYLGSNGRRPRMGQSS